MDLRATAVAAAGGNDENGMVAGRRAARVHLSLPGRHGRLPDDYPTTATLVVVGAAGGEERQLVQFELALMEGEHPRRLTIA